MPPVGVLQLLLWLVLLPVLERVLQLLELELHRVQQQREVAESFTDIEQVGGGATGACTNVGFGECRCFWQHVCLCTIEVLQVYGEMSNR